MASAGEIPAAEFTPHQFQSDEHGQPEFVRVLGKKGSQLGTLSIVAGGGQLFYSLSPDQVLSLGVSAIETYQKIMASAD